MSSSTSYDHICKILVIGNTLVGKSSVIARLTGRRFKERPFETIGIDYIIHTVVIDGLRVRLQIWDTAGLKKLNTVTPVHYERAVGVILVYGINDKTSFENIQGWLEIVRDFSSANVEKLIIGNKSDLESERVVKMEEGIRLAEANHALFFETSAKQNNNIVQSIYTLTRHILANRFLIPMTMFRETADHKATIPRALRLAYEKESCRRCRIRQCCQKCCHIA